MTEPTLFTEQLGQRIKDRREELNLSLDGLARKTDLSKTGLWQIEKGVSVARVNTLLRLCHVLKISPNKLMLGTEEFSL